MNISLFLDNPQQMLLMLSWAPTRFFYSNDQLIKGVFYSATRAGWKSAWERRVQRLLCSDGLNSEASDVELADQSINQACYKHTQLKMIMSRPRFAAEEEEIFWGDANCLMILLIFNQSSSVFLGLGKKEVVWIFARHTLAKNVYAGSADNNDKQLIKKSFQTSAVD